MCVTRTLLVWTPHFISNYILLHVTDGTSTTHKEQLSPPPPSKPYVILNLEESSRPRTLNNRMLGCGQHLGSKPYIISYIIPPIASNLFGRRLLIPTCKSSPKLQQHIHRQPGKVHLPVKFTSLSQNFLDSMSNQPFPVNFSSK